MLWPLGYSRLKDVSAAHELGPTNKTGAYISSNRITYEFHNTAKALAGAVLRRDSDGLLLTILEDCGKALLWATLAQPWPYSTSLLLDAIGVIFPS